MLYCNITSHVQGAKDQQLLEEKGGEGFPYLIFMDAGGNLLTKHEGPRTAQGFEETGSKARNYLNLKAKAEKGSSSVKIDFILAQLELGQIKSGEAEVKIRETGGKISSDQQKKLDGLLANSEVEQLLRTVKDAEGKNKAAKACYDRLKEGKPAPTADPWQVYYWSLILEQSESLKDAAAFEQSLNVLREKYGNVPQAKQYLDQKAEVLKKLKEQK